MSIVGSYVPCFPRSMNGMGQLIRSPIGDNDFVADHQSISEPGYEMLESVYKPLENYIMDWDVQHVSAHVHDILLTPDTMEIIHHRSLLCTGS